jgi:hypothetical protein
VGFLCFRENAMNVYEKEIERYAELFQQHRLEIVLLTKDVQVFYLKQKPDSRMMSSMITITREGIALQGDVTPTRNGTCSVVGYGLGWFRGRLDYSYLAEKFLSEQWSPDLARENLQAEIKDMRESVSHTDVERWRIGIADFTGTEPDALALFAEEAEQWDWFSSFATFDQELPAYRDGKRLISPYDSEFTSAMGYGYDPRATGILSAIQRRFKEEIDRLLPTEERSE